MNKVNYEIELMKSRNQNEIVAANWKFRNNFTFSFNFIVLSYPAMPHSWIADFWIQTAV